ncbi:ATP synthase g subunit [Capsaspora owczarzaki ATCC 30864]|uniref:ATP synthase g subunit n=1 Tax=Capsaspora owczarzaki (strain ATCC 30864) TaxID=595528 RepID=A0A0D2UN13_CAPO3|nr:ATP synthase g subunit [Capsaspora owczarzaki ATCC 30864]KJE96426.1 ATP synthase g subunit [Capsaspora owczarzaki ATCC 30864]|eukprot:XP_004344377.2 ATP synthase g subunit [Capsaspora owczarzaki ATCC 30864]
MRLRAQSFITDTHRHQMAAVQKLAQFGTALVQSSGKLVNTTIRCAETVAPHVKTFAKNAKAELLPPLPAEFGEVSRDASKVIHSAQKLSFLNLPIKEAVQKTLVGVEIACWFFVGEIIARGSLVGYADKHADAHHDAHH